MILNVPCKIWDGPKDKDGYGTCWYEGKKTRTHRVAYVKHNGLTLDDISGLVIRHKCDVRACIEGSHLETGTHSENVADRVARGRTYSKLTDEQVAEIRNSYIRGSSENGLFALAEIYGVSQMQISRIVNMKRRIK